MRSALIDLDVKPSTTVCISLNKLHQEITADVWRPTAAAAAGEKALSSRSICVACKLATCRPAITSPSNTSRDVICHGPRMHAISALHLLVRLLQKQPFLACRFSPDKNAIVCFFKTDGRIIMLFLRYLRSSRESNRLMSLLTRHTQKHTKPKLMFQ